MEYPVNSTARVYSDSDGNECTLRQLIKREPEWAYSRIVALEGLLKETLPIVERSEVNVYPESLSIRVKANIGMLIYK